MTLPRELIDQVRAGRVILFLGTSVINRRLSPTSHAAHLSKEIANNFLGAEHRNRSLEEVASLAISEHGLETVQRFVAEACERRQPPNKIEKIPSFVWRAIVTTSYSLVVERAYESASSPLQRLVPFYKNDQLLDTMLRSQNSLEFLKLHGCISRVEEKNVPLILTPGQYVTHRDGRSRLFERLVEYASEHPIIFVAQSLSDADLRSILFEVSQAATAMPRSYIVVPEYTDADVRFWEARRFACIKASLDETLDELDSKIPHVTRGLAVKTRDGNKENPVTRKLSLRVGEALTAQLDVFLSREVDYVHAELALENVSPTDFYRGHYIGWPEIVQGLDVVRENLLERIIERVFLPEEDERESIQELFIIKGHAGSGKSVALHRLAWTAGVEYDVFCIFLRPEGHLDYECISELQRLYRSRVFIFVDTVSFYLRDVLRVLVRAKDDQIPISIIGTERSNQWNDSCDELEFYVTDEFQIRYLNEAEIGVLIQLLEKHHSLGHLKGLPPDKQHEALSKKAGRQLLVALHEATLGKSFSEIILDEYNSISSPTARELYRTICILHRLHVVVRAGLISRIHKIGFQRFKSELSKPLDSIVFARRGDMKDYYYISRHPHIAEMVVERVLCDQNQRAKEYERVISGLDVGFRSDRKALAKLTKAKSLLDFFSDPSLVLSIYRSAHLREKESPYLLQQEAIFEKNRPNGDLRRATRLLYRAQKIAPGRTTIAHTIAELNLVKSKRSLRPLERKKFRETAKRDAVRLLNQSSQGGSHAYHTLLKAEIEELREALGDKKERNNIERKISEFEAVLKRALKRYPGDTHLLDAEADFSELISKSERGMRALEEAFNSNPTSAFIALRLARVYNKNNKKGRALRVLTQCVESNPGDKRLFYELAILTEDGTSESRPLAKHYLKKSFTKGDTNYDAQFQFARLEFLDGNTESAKELFALLKTSGLPYSVKKRVRGHVAGYYQGTVKCRFSRYAFVERDGDGAEIFLHPDEVCGVPWSRINVNTRLDFSLAFNFFGAVALRASIEKFG